MGSSIRAAQPISDPGFGQDELRAFVVGFNFLSELPNKDPHSAVIGAVRRERLLDAVLNHWDETVAYAALCCLVMGFD